MPRTPVLCTEPLNDSAVVGPECRAFDIGGANIKAATSNGYAINIPFALWKHPGELHGQVQKILDELPGHGPIALTMTAELCDCFESKSVGVLTILDQFEQALGTEDYVVWTTDELLEAPAAIRDSPLRAAASNWLALGRYVSTQVATGCGLLIDVGSTTTDIIPFTLDGPCPKGRDDIDRLATGELVYTGITRTPLATIGRRVTVDGREYGVAAEHFGSTQDLYVLDGSLPEDPTNCDTADGKSVTRTNAIRRIARMLCGDVESLGAEFVLALADKFRTMQRDEVATSCRAIVSSQARSPEVIIVSGIGEFLAQRVAVHLGFNSHQIVSLRESIGSSASAAACAFALARIVMDRNVDIKPMVK